MKVADKFQYRTQWVIRRYVDDAAFAAEYGAGEAVRAEYVYRVINLAGVPADAE